MLYNLISIPHESNRIELSQIRIRFDRITNRIPWLSRDVTQISKKGNFCFRENWKVALHKVAQISKKGIFLPIISNSIRSDSIRFDSIRIWFGFGQFGFDSNSIRFGPNRISSIRIRFADHKSESNSNRIRIRIWIWFDLTNRLRNPTLWCEYVYILIEVRHSLWKMSN